MTHSPGGRTMTDKIEKVVAAPVPTDEFPNPPRVEVVEGEPPTFGVEVGRYGGPAGCRLCLLGVARPETFYEPQPIYLRLPVVKRPAGGGAGTLRRDDVDPVCI